MKKMEFEMQHANIGEEMSSLVDFILSPDEGGLSDEELQMAAVAFEEAFVNVCSYSYGGEEGYARVVVEKAKDSVTIHLFDKGGYFDPTKAEIKDITYLQVGGHGLRLMREYASMTYESSGGENHLTMVVPKELIKKQ